MRKNDDEVAEFRKRAHELLDRMLDGALEASERETMLDMVPMVKKGALELGETVVRTAAVARARRTRKTKPVAKCDKCDDEMAFKQLRPIIVRTELTGGAEAAPSAYYVCKRCHLGRMELRTALGLDGDGFTPGLRELAVRAGTVEPFEAAAEELLQRVAGVDVSKTKVHRLCQSAGSQAWTLMAEGTLGEARELNEGERLIVEIDGGMAHIDDGWHEVKLAVFFPERDLAAIHEGRRAVLHRRVVATRGDRDELGGLLLNAAARFLPHDADGAPLIAGRVVVLSDGAPWIRNLVEEFLPGAMVILDWYHVIEHLHEAARAAIENERARDRWIAKQQMLLRDGRADVLLRELRQKIMRSEVGGAAHDALKRLHRYLEERRDALCYREARLQNLCIGSGVAESSIKNVLQQRMKLPGMRWGPHGADAMIALRCAYRSRGGMETLFASQRSAA